MHLARDFESPGATQSAQHASHLIVDDFDIAGVEMGAPWHVIDYIPRQAHRSKPTRSSVQSERRFSDFCPKQSALRRSPMSKCIATSRGGRQTLLHTFWRVEIFLLHIVKGFAIPRPPTMTSRPRTGAF
jgi:hypothetical protein